MKHVHCTRTGLLRAAVVRSVLLILTLSTATNWAFAQRPDVGGKRDLKVMTVNSYIGADFSPLTTLNPSDPDFGVKFLTGVATIYGRILASNFPVRAEAIARQIALRGPDVIALQEVILIRRQSPGDAIAGGTTAATNVVLDYLQILLAALEHQGAHYAVASASQDLDVEVPLATGPGTFDDLRLTDREVILVRTDLPPGYLRTTNPQNGNYAAGLPLPIGITVLRGWCSIDLQVRGRQLRVINTHLEEALPPFLPDIQGFQAFELLSGPANTNLPVVLAGDLNSDAYGNYGPSVYPLLTSFGGFNDAWSVARPGELGLTWGHDQFLADPRVLFSLRIDDVLYRGSQLHASDAETIDLMIRATPPPLWFSDHAAVIAELEIR
jgi:endonuclease/exonuclease/phosphatase family metal-dependent hydrolase